MNHHSLGLLCMLFASIFFSLMNACIKILSPDLSITQCMFFRSILMSAFVALLFLFKPLEKTNTKGGYFPLLIRGFFGASSMLLFFYNISTIPLGTASTFAQTVPLYAVFFAHFFLKESLSLLVVFATWVGFCGILLISNPSTNIPLSNIIIGLLSGVTAAIALVSVRGCKKYFDERMIILSFGLIATAMSAIGIVLNPMLGLDFLAWKPLLKDLWIYILAMGITGTLGQYLMTKAFMLAPAGLVSPLDYAKIIFSLLLGMALGDPFPDMPTFIGMLLVIFSGLLIALPIFLRDLQSLKTRI